VTDVSMLAGAGIFLVGMITNRILPVGRRRRKIKPVKPICGCGDSVSFHENGTGRCHATRSHFVNRPDADYELTDCGCQKYTGPEPLPSLYAPEITNA
jgi:hypothetical protein